MLCLKEVTTVYFIKLSYNSQSTVNTIATKSLGNPTVSRTISIVTNPACGIAAAPTDARIDVKLKKETERCYNATSNKFVHDLF